MEYLLLFFVLTAPLSLIIIWFGGKREIGSKNTFWITLFFSPLVGLIALLLSRRKEEHTFDYFSELLKLTQLKDGKIISVEEFEKEKNRLAQSRYEYENPIADKAGFYYYLIVLGVVVSFLVVVFFLVVTNEGKAPPYVYTLF